MPDMSSGQHWCGLLICESIWHPDCSPISCLYYIFTLLCPIIVHPCVNYCFLHVLPISLQIVFWLLLIMCTLIVIAIALDGPVWIWLWIVFDVFQDSIQWVNLSVCIFCGLVVYVIVCCYWCRPDMLSVACDSPTSCCNLYGVWSVMVIVVSLPNHCPMGPQSTIFSLNCYSWPYWNRCKDWWSIIVCVVFVLPVH